MSKVVRAGFFAIPLCAAALAVMAACGDDEEPPIKARDAAADAVTTDVVTRDSSVADGSSDGGVTGDADAALPALCTIYPDNEISDADLPFASWRRRWTQIPFLAFFEGANNQNVISSCELGNLYADPFAMECLAQQIRSVVGCVDQSQPVVYGPNSADSNGTKCLGTDAGNIHVGFFEPGTEGYTNRDFDFMLSLVKKAALSTGMAEGDATRLVQQLESRRATVVLDASAGDAGYSHTNPANCP